MWRRSRSTTDGSNREALSEESRGKDGNLLRKLWSEDDTKKEAIPRQQPPSTNSSWLDVFTRATYSVKDAASADPKNVEKQLNSSTGVKTFLRTWGWGRGEVKAVEDSPNGKSGTSEKLSSSTPTSWRQRFQQKQPSEPNESKAPSADQPSSSFFNLRNFLSKRDQVPDSAAPKAESRIALPSTTFSPSLERTKAQLRDLKTQVESSVVVVKAKEQADVMTQELIQRSAELKDQAVARTREAADQAITKSKTIIIESKERSAELVRRKLDDASDIVQSSVQKAKEKPQQLVQSVKSTRDEIAFRSIKQARKARNFMVGVFLGGCFAFGLGLGLGSGGITFRRRSEE